jgi:hypothetical protein
MVMGRWSRNEFEPRGAERSPDLEYEGALEAKRVSRETRFLVSALLFAAA